MIHEILLVSLSKSSVCTSNDSMVVCSYRDLSRILSTLRRGRSACTASVVRAKDSSARMWSHLVASSNDSYADLEILVERKRTVKPSLDNASVAMT